MPNVKLQSVVHSIRTMARSPLSTQWTDQQLLQAFAAHGEQSAFAALVNRHGSMVMHVCRRVLHHEQDAEDAFQATFLVLAGKAGSIRKTEALASWLHGVAHRVALRARRDLERRRTHEREGQAMAARRDRRETSWSEVQAALDEEVQSLPEKWRAPFVLCFLEGRSRAEAARELGLKEGTVWSRLSHARKLLHAKLVQRGITLSELLTTAALAEDALAAVPAGLAKVTIQAAATAGQAASAGLIPVRAADLANGVIKGMSMLQKKTVGLCLATTALVALAGGTYLLGIASARPPAEKDRPEKTSTQPQPQPEERVKDTIDDSGESVRLTGRVVGPDGKAVAGAKLTLWSHFGYTAAYKAWHPNTTEPFQPRQLGASGKDGRFTATYRKSEIVENPLNMWPRPWRMVQVVAAAPGYGPAWASLDRPDKGEFTLRLVKDDVPIKGRVINLEGRPVVGATVRVVRLTIGNDVHNSLWQTSWAGLADNLKTGADGRFTLTGVGRGRNVLLSIEGSESEHKLVGTKTPAADAPAVPTPEVVIIAGPSKPIEGTVRDRATGKPIAGVAVYGGEEFHRRLVRAVTDAKGHYRLTGLLKAKSYPLTFYPPMATGYLGTAADLADSEGLQPITANVELRRGIEVRCRFIDKETRKPVQGELRYTPLESNPLYPEAEKDRGFVPNRTFSQSHVPGPDGVIRLVVYPGLGMLFGLLQGNQKNYRPGVVDPADMARAKGSIHFDFAKLTGVYRLIEPKERDKPLSVDIELVPEVKKAGEGK